MLPICPTFLSMKIIWRTGPQSFWLDEFRIRDGIRITLEKHIPVAAGMAGGSSNAAAVLHGMNRMYGLGLSEEGLKERGVTLGADVPYCIMRGTVLAEGIGEILTPLAAHAQMLYLDGQAAGLCFYQNGI